MKFLGVDVKVGEVDADVVACDAAIRAAGRAPCCGDRHHVFPERTGPHVYCDCGRFIVTPLGMFDA